MACQVIDWAMQVHGGGGMCRRLPARPTPTRSARTLRFADGPDEVHRNADRRGNWASTHRPRRDAEMPVTRF